MNKHDIPLILILTLIVGYALSQSLTPKSDICTAWTAYAVSDNQKHAYNYAGCQNQDKKPMISVCQLWIDVITNENEAGAWSQVCGTPKAGGGCNIWLDDNGKVIVEGICKGDFK